MSSSKRMAKRLLSVVLTIMMLMSMVTIGMASSSAANVDLAETGANSVTGGYLYFDNSKTKWTDAYIYFCIGHDSYTSLYQMSKISGTDLYYAKMDSWGGSTYYAVIGTSSSWGSGSWGPSNLTNATHRTAAYTSTYGLNSGSFYLFTPAGASNGTSLSISYIGSAYSSFNKNQTVQQNIEAATVSVSTTRLNGNNTSVASTATGTSATAAAAKTASVTASYSNMADGYNFLGWSTDGTNVTSTDATYTYTCDGTAKTVYAMFEEKAVETTTVPATTTTPATTSDPVEETSSTPASADESTPVDTTPVETTTVPATTASTPVEATVALAWAEADGLYAYASITETPGEDAWQRWTNVDGTRRIYLPASASDTEVILYSTYTTDVTVNGVTIAPGEFEVVPYTEGTAYTCSGATTQTVKIYKTDAEASLFVNAADGMTAKYDGSDTKVDKDATFDIMSFFQSGTKNQEIAKAGGAVADANGVIDEQVKKMKGRGNTTWSESKKPFNITFKNAVSVDDMLAGTKWSLLANAKDASLLRNRLVYDMANEVDMTYACDSRFVDFFVSGRYIGSYQLTQKIEMGAGTVMPDLTEPDEDNPPTSNFDFILELDTSTNADSSEDTWRKTNRNQVMTFKTPGEPTDDQITWAMAKYQAVEDALYGNDMETLAELVDIDDFAKAYLINEISKNIDAGVTSCYFTYNSAQDKFYLSPVWDFDNAVGNLSSGRNDVDGNALDLANPDGWYAREMAHFDSAFTGKRSVFSQAWYTTSETADGETFADVVERVWNAEFLDLVDILEGTTDGAGRLNSVEGYMSNLAKSGQWNYDAGWTLKQSWTASHSSLTMYDYDADTNTLTSSRNSYDVYDAQDMNQYAGDWLISRINWMAAQYADADEEVNDSDITVYFQNNWMWTNVKAHVWDDNGDITTWPGKAATFVANDGTYDIYSVTMPANAYVIFNGTKNDGSGATDQTPDIKDATDGICYYMKWDGANAVGTEPIEVMLPDMFATTAPATTTTPVETTTTPVESSTAPATGDEDATDPTESTVTVPATTVTTPVSSTPVDDTTTVYFQNNWLWTDVKVYMWNDSTIISAAFPGDSMTKDSNDGTYDYYVVEVPADVTAIIFSGIKDDGSGTRDQSPDIKGGWYDGICYCMQWDNGNAVHSWAYKVPETTTPVTTASTPVESDPIESSTAPVGTTAPASDDEDDTTPASSTPVDTGVKVYVINSVKWDEIRAYAWTNDGDTSWPGVEMEFEGVDNNGFDVYSISYDKAYENIIFNNNNKGSQTADLTLENGKYYDLKTTTWYDSLADVPASDKLATDRYLVGSFNSWSTIADEFKLNAEGDNTGYVAIELEANTTYEFKVMRSGAWTGNSSTITDTTEGLVFSSSTSNNCKITTKAAGT